MNVLYAVVKLFPFWAIPTIVIFAELGLYHRRRNLPLQYFFWFSIGLFSFLSALWFVFRGDLHSDSWVRYFLGH